MNRGQTAKENFKKGYNCAQAVVLAFSDLIDTDEKTALRIAAPFGGGVGRMREVCGTVSGMMMVLGAIFYDPSRITTEEKSSLYAREQDVAARFRARNGSIICRELLAGVKTDDSPNAEARTEAYYKKRPCADLCEMAADILEEYLREQGILQKA